MCYLLTAVEHWLKRMHSSSTAGAGRAHLTGAVPHSCTRVPSPNCKLEQLACPLAAFHGTLPSPSPPNLSPTPLTHAPHPQIASNEVSEPLAEAGITRTQLEAALTEVRKASGTGPINSETGDANFEALSKYGTDLTERTPRADPVIGRDDEIRRVVRVLCRRTKNNPVLIGEPGVGKTAIVEGLAQRIVKVGHGGDAKGRAGGRGS